MMRERRSTPGMMSSLNANCVLPSVSYNVR